MQAGEADEAAARAAERVEQYRWVIPAKGFQTLVVQFQSEDMGNFKESLVFEVSFRRSLPCGLPVLDTSTGPNLSSLHQSKEKLCRRRSAETGREHLLYCPVETVT